MVVQWVKIFVWLQWLSIGSPGMSTKSKSPLGELLQEVSAELKPADWKWGLPDLILALILLIVYLGLLLSSERFAGLGSFFEHWYAWELVAIIATPSLVWIFEKRGAEDPRSIDVPRWLRILLPVGFLIVSGPRWPSLRNWVWPSEP